MKPTAELPNSNPTSDHERAARPAAASLVLKLFLLPLAAVSVFTVTALLISRSRHAPDDVTGLVRDLEHVDEDSWRKAYALSQMLRSGNGIKTDAAVCRELANVLSRQMGNPDAGPSRTRLRVFLCRALGEFHLPDGLPALLDAAEARGDGSGVSGPDERIVRRAAVEAIAVLAANIGPEIVAADPRTVRLLLAATRAPSDDPANGTDDLRSSAAFALGVLGGTAAIDRLVELLDDPNPNVRYNAATALSRHGDARASPVVLEMLNPENEDALRDEMTSQAREEKRAAVLRNGLRAGIRLIASNPTVDSSKKLSERISFLSNATTVSARTRMDAKRAVLELRDLAHGHHGRRSE